MEITEQHWPVCEKYPVACPNACSAGMVERMALPNHLEKCPEEKVKCMFSRGGCQWEGVRKELDGHMEARWRCHMSLLSNHFVKKLENQVQTLQDKVTQQEKRLNSVIKLSNVLSKKVIALSRAQKSGTSSNTHACSLPSRPLWFEVDQISYKIANYHVHHSPQFYLGAGYHMQVSVYPGGRSAGQDTHVSVYARILWGEDDNRLKWPFRGSLTVRLCSQSPGVSNHELNIVYDDKVSTEYSGRVHNCGVSAEYGCSKYLPHAKLDYYLEDDTLTFELPQVPDFDQ